MDDIRRPTPPRPKAPQIVEPSPEPAIVLPPIEPIPDNSAPLLRPKKKKLFWVLIALGLVILVSVSLWATYLSLLQPVNSKDSSAQKVVIKSGQTFSVIADELSQRSIIKNPLAFEIMARLAGKHNDVKAGTCTLKRSESASEILDKITSGCHDFKAITFYPGATIYHSPSKPNSLDVTDVLLAAGYSQSEVDAALARTYTTQGINLFADKPAGTDLEGYIYGETYYVDLGASAETVIQTALDQMAGVIQDGGYVSKFKQQGLNLYEGITLASIVQRELSCTSGVTACYQNQQTIAQVFYRRLANSMTLGSDVTFYYAADKLGVAPSTTLDSPYNTRKYAGLPPGPIAAPGKHALDAVANPATTDYLFFVAGDDGTVHFARTDTEHEANIAAYCKTLCKEP